MLVLKLAGRQRFTCFTSRLLTLLVPELTPKLVLKHAVALRDVETQSSGAFSAIVAMRYSVYFLC